MSAPDTPPRPRDLNLKASLDSFQGFGELPSLKTESLRSVGEAYERNIRRVYALLMFPLAAITTAAITSDVLATTNKDMPRATQDELARAVNDKLDNNLK